MKKKGLNRREFLYQLGALQAASLLGPLAGLGRINQAHAVTRKKYLVVVRSLFAFRDRNRTNLANDLGPLGTWANGLTLVQGLSTKGDGSEYHNGKQIRFATSCRPGSRNNRNLGGGAFNGQSVDVATGRHLQNVLKSRHPFLILGAAPYSDSKLHTTFESISFNNKDQYIRPQYKMNDLITQIRQHGGACENGGTQSPQVDRQKLMNENRALEAILGDLSRSSEGKSISTKNQVEALEKQIVDLRTDNDKKMTEGGENNNCVNLRENPVAHAYNRPGIISGNFDAHVRRMNFAAAMALRTNFSPVVTLNYNFSGHAQPNVPAFHEMTHPGGFARAPNNQELANLDALSAFQVQMLAHLFKELANMGVLQDTLVVYAPHERPTHNHRDVPVLAYGATKTGSHQSGLRIQDINKDILDHFGVPNSNNFGGERSKGGVLV